MNTIPIKFDAFVKNIEKMDVLFEEEKKEISTGNREEGPPFLLHSLAKEMQSYDIDIKREYTRKKLNRFGRTSCKSNAVVNR